MKLNFLLNRFLKKDKKVKQWLKPQSFSDDAILYLIQKEIYENGISDLSYLIPRFRNDEYFASVSHRPIAKNKTAPSNLNDGIFGDYMPEDAEKPTIHKPSQTIQPLPDVVPINVHYNKDKNESKIYNSHSSSIYLAESQLTDINATDLSCYDD